MKTSVNLSLTVHPQAEGYRNQNRQLQAESVRLIVECDELKNLVVPQIFAAYQCKIGVFELRVFQFECEIRSLLRRIELAQTALNRGEKPCYQSIEKEIKTEFAAWREKISHQIREIKAAKERENLPTLSYAESREMQTLYRKLAFLLHPDIIGETDDRRQKLWLQAMEAYKNGDLQTLRTISVLIGNESKSLENDSADENILESLKQRNAELKQICEKFLDEITEIKTSEPYIWHKILDDKSELEKCQNELLGKIEMLREKRQQLCEHWAEIMSFAADREDVEIPKEPANIFTEMEDNWAEIIYEF
jgi:hypothetical protein